MFADSPEWLLPVLILGLVAAAFWYALRPRSVFTLRIENGSVAAMAGTVTRSFVHDVEEVCRRASVPAGEIRGLARGRAIVLAFSGPIPGECRQQLRNLWQMHGSLR
jgi:Protein of unknown function (DUF3634)